MRRQTMRRCGWLSATMGLALLTAGSSPPAGTAAPPAAPAELAHAVGPPADSAPPPGDFEPQPSSAAAGERYRNTALTGRVVWLANALARRGDTQVDADQGTSVAVLEASDGRLWPLLKDARGRGFWLDERLRDREVELLVRQFADLPWVQVIRVYTIRDGERYWFDYWCDICAIPMFELKACECCQGPIRMRERPLGPDGQPLDEPEAD